MRTHIAERKPLVKDLENREKFSEKTFEINKKKFFNLQFLKKTLLSSFFSSNSVQIERLFIGLCEFGDRFERRGDFLSFFLLLGKYQSKKRRKF